MSRLRVLMVMEEISPAHVSVPLIAYRLWDQVSRLCGATLVTHERNRPYMEPVRGGREIVYVGESGWITAYYEWSRRVTAMRTGAINYPLRHMLSCPVYLAFNRKVHALFRDAVRNGEYDLVHAMTPITPRYPVKLARACGRVPFIMGPVNGGLPYPEGFRHLGAREFARLNFFRSFARRLPGYAATYRKADLVLFGSLHTRDMVQGMLGLSGERLEVFHENGVEDAVVREPRTARSGVGDFHAVFAGRLESSKGADMAIRAVARARELSGADIRLTLAGEGSERGGLERLAHALDLGEAVRFLGWVEHGRVWDLYRGGDAFLFPSVCEFGGAVVLEAMAAGLPCIIPDYGGIGEYATHGTGTKLALSTPEALIEESAQALVRMHRDVEAWRAMSAASVERAREYTWGAKGRRLAAIYREVLSRTSAGARA